MLIENLSQVGLDLTLQKNDVSGSPTNTELMNNNKVLSSLLNIILDVIFIYCDDLY